MAQFVYRAMNARGRTVKGSIAAANEMDLYQQLRAGGLELIDYRERRAQAGSSYFAPRVTLRDLIQLTMHLQQLLKAGVPVVEALADVRDATESPRLRDALVDVYQDVNEGQMLSAAFGKHKKVFPGTFESLIGAGEGTGNLTDAFDQLNKFLRWTEAMRTRIRKAVSYPALLSVVMLGLIFFMMTMVVPQVVEFLEFLGEDLPWTTRSLMAVSSFFVNYWWVLVLTPLVGFVAIRIGVKTSEDFAYKVDYYALQLPIIGPMLRKIGFSRFAHNFGAMFDSGVEILDGLESATKAVTNRALAEALGVVRDQVRGGNPLSMSLRVSGEFPPLIVRMVRIGEESGNLSEVLHYVSDFYDKEVDEAIDGMIAKLEPAMTFTMGLLMVWLAAAVFGPLYGSFQSIGA